MIDLRCNETCIYFTPVNEDYGSCLCPCVGAPIQVPIDAMCECVQEAEEGSCPRQLNTAPDVVLFWMAGQDDDV